MSTKAGELHGRKPKALTSASRSSWRAARPAEGHPLALLSAPRLAIGVTALGGLVVTTAVLAAGAASLPSLLVPASRARPVPDWLAGPLAGLEPRLHEGEYALLALGLLVLYVVAVACASSLPAGGTLATIGALHGILLLAPPLLSPDVFGYLGYARLEVLYGLNPYAVGPDALGDADPVAPFLRHGATPSPYGPLFTIASLPVAKLTVPAGLWAFKAASAEGTANASKRHAPHQPPRTALPARPRQLPGEGAEALPAPSGWRRRRRGRRGRRDRRRDQRAGRGLRGGELGLSADLGATG